MNRNMNFDFQSNNNDSPVNRNIYKYFDKTNGSEHSNDLFSPKNQTVSMMYKSGDSSISIDVDDDNFQRIN